MAEDDPGGDDMVPDRRTLLAVCLAAALALSGCTSAGPLQEGGEDEIVAEFENRFGEIDGVTATIHSENRFENQTHEFSAEIWFRPDTGEMRQEVLAPDEQAGDVIVTNGSTSVYYDASENEYTRTELGSAGEVDVGSQLSNFLEAHDVIYNGTDTVDGQETHEVTLVPAEPDETPGAQRITMWLDTEELFPVRMETVNEEYDMRNTVRFENVSVDPGIPDERFTFDPPADAELREVETPDVSEYDSREELADATDRPLPAPGLPDGFEFEQGTVIESDEYASTTIQYGDGDDTLTVSLSTGSDVAPNGDETVQVGNRTAHYAEYGEFRSVSWACEDVLYGIHSEVDRSTLLDVASSIECP